MRKSILTEQNMAQLIDRTAVLQPAATPLWGNMTAAEMLFHCTKVNNEILKSKKTDNIPQLKQRLIKFLALNLLKNLPKGIKTNAKFVKKEEDNLTFATEKSNFVKSIKEFAAYKNAIYGNHPFFGPLNTIEWRRFVWMHTDHHLRQFGA